MKEAVRVEQARQADSALFVTASTALTTVAAEGNVLAVCVITFTEVTPESTGTLGNAGQA